MDTSFFSDMNWLAVLVAAVAYFMLGALWYSKALFGNAWIKYSGVLCVKQNEVTKEFSQQ